MHKISQIFQLIRETKIIQGNKFYFYLFFLLTYLRNFVRRVMPRANFIGDFLKKMLPRKVFIISNSIGKFYVSAFNDSLVISSPYFEKELVTWLYKTQNRITFFDIGANIGRYTLLANVAGYKKIISFEANPTVVPVLSKNVILNGLNNRVSIKPIALSSEVGQLNFSYDENHFGGGMVSFSSETFQNRTYTKVNCITLDLFVKNEKIDPTQIDFIKIDVEGHEFEVLLGGKTVFKQMPTDSRLMIEISQDPQNQKNVFENLHEFGFALMEQKNCDYLFSKN